MPRQWLYNLQKHIAAFLGDWEIVSNQCQSPCTQGQAQILEWGDERSECQPQLKARHCMRVASEDGDAIHLVDALCGGG